MNNLNGMPIQFLNGIDDVDTVDTVGNVNTQDIDLQLEDIISGVDLLNGLQGIDGIGYAAPRYQISSKAAYAVPGAKYGSVKMSANKGIVSDKAMFEYLVKTRNVIAAKPYMVQNQDPKTALKMVDYAIKYWHTPMREKALDVLDKAESKLMGLGSITYPVHFYSDGEPLEGFFKKVKNAMKKAGSAIKTGAQKAVRALQRFNPVLATIRGGILAAFNMNMGQIATKLYPAINPSGFSVDVINASNDAYDRIKKHFVGKLGGKESKMQKAIRKGYTRKWTKKTPTTQAEIQAEFKANASEVASSANEEAANSVSGIGNPLVAAEAASKAGNILSQIIQIITNAFKKVKDKVNDVKDRTNKTRDNFNSSVEDLIPGGAKVDRSGDGRTAPRNVPQAYNPASQSGKTYDSIEEKYIDQNSNNMSDQNQETMNNPNPSMMDKVKKYAPIAIGVLAVGAAAYFFTKKKGKGVNGLSGLSGLEGTRKRRKKPTQSAKVVKVLALGGAKRKKTTRKKTTRKARRVRVR